MPLLLIEALGPTFNGANGGSTKVSASVTRTVERRFRAHSRSSRPPVSRVYASGCHAAANGWSWHKAPVDVALHEAAVEHIAVV